MTLFGDLVTVYDQNQNRAGEFDASGLVLVPIAHNQINVQLEVALDEHGNFLAARSLAKEEQATVIPATIAAANRTSKPVAYPLTDKLIYVAGDFAQILSGKDKDKAIEKHRLYIDELSSWANSEFATNEIKAIYAYIEKGSVLTDILQGGEITDEKERIKIKKGDWLVRFVVNQVPVFREKRIFNAWTQYYLKSLNDAPDATWGIDYVTGKRVVTTKVVEDGVSARDNKAKLVSANDNSAYTYRGLFLGDEFYQLGYTTAQKVIHTLSWLVKRQGVYVGNRAFVFWGQSGENDAPVDALTQMLGQFKGGNPEEIATITRTNKAHGATDVATGVALSYRQRLVGKIAKISEDEAVTVAAFDAATTGRMAVVYYNRLPGSMFKRNVQAWSDLAKSTRYLGSNRVEVTPTFRQIIKMAYQVGSNSSRFDTMSKRAMLGLMTSVATGRPIQLDLYQAAFHHVIRPTTYKSSEKNSFDAEQWWNDIYNFSSLSRYKKGRDEKMNETDYKNSRSYLFGELLAVANDMETRAVSVQRVSNPSVSDRETMALRYYRNFTEAPAAVWNRIKKGLYSGYNRHLSKFYRKWYLDQFTAIETKLGVKMGDDTPLDPIFIAGFSEKRTAMQEERDAYAKESKKND